MSARVSVVVANYNMAQFVEQAVCSVLSQTVSPLEVIVVDDGSTDGSRDVIRRLAAIDDRVILIEQGNSGQTRAKNVGLARAVGEFVGFCDADDYWLPDKLERQLPFFDALSVAVVFSLARRIDSHGSTVDIVPQAFHTGRVLDQLIVENFIPFGTALVRREAFLAAGGFNERYRMGIDWEAWLRLAVHHEFSCVDDVTYIYRIWDGQMSKNTGGRFEAALQIMRDFRAQNPSVASPDALAQGFAMTYANRAYWHRQSGAGASKVLSDLLRALRHRPHDVYTWKTALKCVLGR